jgi:hypothetical protein
MTGRSSSRSFFSTQTGLAPLRSSVPVRVIQFHSFVIKDSIPGKDSTDASLSSICVVKMPSFPIFLIQICVVKLPNITHPWHIVEVILAVMSECI